MHPITIAFPFRPIRRSLATAQVADLFGLADDEPPHVVANDLRIDIQPGDLVLFSGPSGSGKSSLLRETGRQLGAVDVAATELPDRPLVDCLTGSIERRLSHLSACGLSEARILLRRPAELSDGQRCRFRLALALNVHDSLRKPNTVLLIDEFAALLDRTLAKVLAFNLRKLCSRTGLGFLLATAHDDLHDDLNPNLHVRCHGAGAIEVERRVVANQPISFAADLRMTEGSLADWPAFAHWHYRSHHLAFVKRVVLLWHGKERVGICVFTSPAASLQLRSRYFGMTKTRSSTALTALNQQLWLLSRVVLHPTYRGAGIAADFIRQACETCPVPWIETLTAMGRVSPFFERAGFVRVGVVRKKRGGKLAGAFGRRASVSAASEAKSLHSEPVYYVFDNRKNVK